MIGRSKLGDSINLDTKIIVRQFLKINCDNEIYTENC